MKFCTLCSYVKLWCLLSFYCLHINVFLIVFIDSHGYSRQLAWTEPYRRRRPSLPVWQCLLLSWECAARNPAANQPAETDQCLNSDYLYSSSLTTAPTHIDITAVIGLAMINQAGLCLRSQIGRHFLLSVLLVFSGTILILCCCKSIFFIFNS